MGQCDEHDKSGTVPPKLGHRVTLVIVHLRSENYHTNILEREIICTYYMKKMNKCGRKVVIICRLSLFSVFRYTFPR